MLFCPGSERSIVVPAGRSRPVRQQTQCSQASYRRPLRRAHAFSQRPHTPASPAAGGGQFARYRLQQGSPGTGRGGRAVRPHRPDSILQPQHRRPLLPAARQRGVRRIPLWQGARRRPPGGAAIRRRRPVHRGNTGTQLAKGTPDPDAGVRAGGAEADVRGHGRHRRAAAAQVGKARPHGPDRRSGQHHPPDAGHDRPVLVQIPVQQSLPGGDASLRRGHGPRPGRIRGSGPQAPGAEQDHAAPAAPARGRQCPDVRGRRADDQRPAAQSQPGGQRGHPRHHAQRGGPGDRRAAVR